MCVTIRPTDFVASRPIVNIQIFLLIKVEVGSKQKLETNYYDQMYKNCHISASRAPRHLKIGKERAYTMIHHKMNLFLSRTYYVSNNMA